MPTTPEVVMETGLTPPQVAELHKQLQQQYAKIVEDIRIELEQSDNEQYIELAGRVRDLEDESVADLLTDVNLAVIDLHIHQLRAIEAALHSIEQEIYGLCVDCGGEIGYPRLHAYPSANRCRDCQERWEATHAGSGHPSL
jgi:DnaK suppressor protein